MTGISVNHPLTCSAPFRAPALLLTLQTLFWVAVIARVFRFYPDVPPGLIDAWSAQRAREIQIPWIALHITMATAFACGTLGILLVSETLRANRWTG